MAVRKYLIGESCLGDQELVSLCSSTSGGLSSSFGATKVEPVVALDELYDFLVSVMMLYEVDDTEEVSLIELLQDDWHLFTSIRVGVDILSEVSTHTPGLLSPTSRVRYVDDLRQVAESWSNFKERLMWQNRFLFRERELATEYGWDSLLQMNQPLDDGAFYYRARIHDEGRTSPFERSEMGAPPKEKCTAGRANVIGIPTLYLCDDPETTLYEVKAGYKDEVSVGRFVQKDKKKKIEIADFSRAPSLFAAYDTLLEWEEVLKPRLLAKRISNDLSKPKRRYDTELEYLPTQFICEYVREISGAKGIRFESSLYPHHTNVVLFEPNLMECVEVKKCSIESVKIDVDDPPIYP